MKDMKIKEKTGSFLTKIRDFLKARKDIAIRFLYTLLFVVVFEIIKLIIEVCVLFQYIFLFLFRKHNEPIRRFSNKVSIYGYKVMRYISLNENPRPYPFAEFPEEIDPPTEEVVHNG